MILDWKEVANKVYKDIKEDILKNKLSPKLSAILVWNSKESLRYINQKQKWAKEVWIDFELLHFSEDISQDFLLKEIEKLNNDKSVSWFIVQLPLPKHIKEQIIINTIDSKKDVDWFTQINQWKVLIWDKSWLEPCTPAWILKLMDFYNIDVVWKNVCVIWRSNIVWKPIANMMINMWATVSVCNSKTKDLSFYTKNADIIISAVWKPWLINQKNINKDSIIIDVWFTVIDDKIYWDANFEEIEKNGNKITPVPGWVWALTVASLLSNTLKAYKNENFSN